MTGLRYHQLHLSVFVTAGAVQSDGLGLTSAARMEIRIDTSLLSQCRLATLRTGTEVTEDQISIVIAL